jgi:hypothetical protein
LSLPETNLQPYFSQNAIISSADRDSFVADIASMSDIADVVNTVDIIKKFKIWGSSIRYFKFIQQFNIIIKSNFLV